MNSLYKHLDPKSKISTEQRTLSCRISATLYLDAQEKAEAEGLSMTQLIRGLLEFYLEAQDDTETKSAG